MEADEEQVNLTRFDLFFPEKRPFFLENASTFQFGNPQQIDLFFSRRIGLSPTALPIDIRGGGRLSGKIGGWNVGVLNIQADDIEDAQRQRSSARPTTSACCACSARSAARATARSSSTGRAPATTRSDEDWNRAYGVDANIQIDAAASACRRSSRAPTRRRSRRPARRAATIRAAAFYNFTNNLWQVSGGYSQVGENFNPEVGFLPRRGYRRPEFRAFFQPQPKNIEWIRRIAPHISYNSFWGFDKVLQTETWHIHPLEIQPKQGGRFGYFFDYAKDNPTAPFTVFNRDGRRVDDPGRPVCVGPERARVPAQPERARDRLRSATTSATTTTATSRACELTSEYRITPKATASVGWTRQDIKLPYGSFVNNLVPIKANYSFTTLINLSALLQYNGQTGQFSSNVRFAMAESQRHRPVRGLQRSPRRAVVHGARNAGPIVRREVHAADRLLVLRLTLMDAASLGHHVLSACPSPLIQARRHSSCG